MEEEKSASKDEDDEEPPPLTESEVTGSLLQSGTAQVGTGGSAGEQPKKEQGKRTQSSEKCVVSQLQPWSFETGDAFMDRVLQEQEELKHESQKCSERQARLTEEARKRDRV